MRARMPHCQGLLRDIRLPGASWARFLEQMAFSIMARNGALSHHGRTAPLRQHGVRRGQTRRRNWSNRLPARHETLLERDATSIP